MDVNYQLIAFDMDGTLLSSKKEVLASSRTAIAEALDAGKVVAICTGRCPKMVELDLESIGDV
ncbi:TPA: HAD hydrolase family protein, partial [Clostridioides difficile]|nr:HAD hydrolase family protein [Clostridioides difficile]